MKQLGRQGDDHVFEHNWQGTADIAEFKHWDILDRHLLPTESYMCNHLRWHKRYSPQPAGSLDGVAIRANDQHSNAPLEPEPPPKPHAKQHSTDKGKDKQQNCTDAKENARKVMFPIEEQHEDQ